MAVTRQPTGQDLVCLVCGTDKDIDIDHVQNRGMGGSKERDVPENKVPLCRECHTAKTNGVLETRLIIPPARHSGWGYQWRRKVQGAPWITVLVEVSNRYKCLVLSAAAESGRGVQKLSEPDIHEKAPGPSTGPTEGSATAPSVGQEESDVRDSVGSDRVDSNAGNDIRPAGRLRSRGTALTHDQRAAIAAGIKEMEWGRQWLAGDTANEWEEELGEDFWNEWANEFGYTYPSLRNNQRVCAAIPENIRRPLRFSHHVVVSDLNREDMEMWLDKCVEEGWSVAEFRRQVKGERPRIKRYSLEELKTAWDEWPAVNRLFDVFLDWLGEQT